MLGVAVLLHLLAWSSAQKELLVYPSVVEERTTDTNLLVRVSDDITLNLEKSSVLAERLLFATDAGSGYHLETIDTASIQENIYHDVNRQSSVHVDHKDGALHIEGIINNKLRIKPLAEAERSSQGQILHSLYEVEEIKKDPEERASSPDSSVWRTLRNGVNSFLPTRTSKPNNVSKFVVELHVISDEEHQANFVNKKELITYLAVMTNAVNLRFLDMQDPSISFKLVGVTNSTNDTFESHIVGTIEANETLYGLVKYYEDRNVPGDPDVVYLITNRNIASISDNGTVQKNVAGLAFIGEVCTPLRVAEGEDVARSYDGVHTMAHELAHVLGARHDVTDECPWSEGFLMSYEDGGPKKYRLSRCSERQIRKVVRKLDDTCIKEVANETLMVNPNFLPGTRTTDWLYCNLILKKLRRIAYPAKPTEWTSQCKMLCCYDIHLSNRATNTTCRVVDILEGMSCENGQVLALLLSTLPALSLQSAYPELRSDLQEYQDISRCYPDVGKWYMMYRNFYTDPIFGGAAKCVTFERYGVYENFSTPVTYSYGSHGSTNGEIALTSSTCYNTKNKVIFVPDNSTLAQKTFYIIYTDCAACYIARHQYAQNGYGCSYWRRADTLNEPADCCEFIYAENCGTSPKYLVFNPSCLQE